MTRRATLAGLTLILGLAGRQAKAFAQEPGLSQPPADTSGIARAPWVLHLTGGSGPRLESLVLGVHDFDSAIRQDTLRRRAKAIELSDAYAVRLKIHQIGSYLEFPVFAAELLVGQRLYNDQQKGVRSSSGLRGAHGALAAGLGVLFGVNTITGAWNLVEGWPDSKGRARRTIHSVAMLLADAGFLVTAATAPHEFERFEGGSSPQTHRTWAISSSALATAATLMMWLWKN